MKEKLVCRCSSRMTAQKVMNALTEAGIAYREHDETNDPHAGTYGPDEGTAIYVTEEDWEQARTLAEPILN